MMPQVLAIPAGHHRRDGALRQRLQLLDVRGRRAGPGERVENSSHGPLMV